jgi:hypothetical protein
MTCTRPQAESQKDPLTRGRRPHMTQSGRHLDQFGFLCGLPHAAPAARPEGAKCDGERQRQERLSSGGLPTLRLNYGSSRRRREMPYESAGGFRLLGSVANGGCEYKVELQFFRNLADQLNARDQQ